MKLRAKIIDCEFDCEGEQTSVWTAFSAWFSAVHRLHFDEPVKTEPAARETHH